MTFSRDISGGFQDNVAIPAHTLMGKLISKRIKKVNLSKFMLGDLFIKNPSHLNTVAQHKAILMPNKVDTHPVYSIIFIRHFQFKAKRCYIDHFAQYRTVYVKITKGCLAAASQPMIMPLI